jgi:hypothetical protein
MALELMLDSVGQQVIKATILRIPSTRQDSNSSIQQIQFQDMLKAISTMTFDTTLFVPANMEKTVNREFLRLLRTESELAC